MKRFIKLFTITILTLMLASCGNLFNRPTKKSELNLTAKELSNLVEGVDLDLDLDKGISFDIAVDIDFSFEEVQKYDYELEWRNLIDISLEGNLNAYANLSSKEDLYAQIKGDLSVSVYLESEGYQEGESFSFDGELDFNAYLVNDNLYVDSHLSAMGISISSKQKVEGVINDKLYDLLFGGLREAIDELDMEFDMTEILDEFEHSELTVYKVGKLHEIEFPFGEFLEEAVADTEYENDKPEYGYYNSTKVNKNDFTGSKAFVRFSDKAIEKIGAAIYTNLEVVNKDVSDYGWQLSDNEEIYKIKGSLEVELDLNASAPKKVDEKKLKGYYEQEEVKVLLNNLLGQEIYKGLATELPKLDKNFTSSSLGIDNGNKEITGSAKGPKVDALIESIDLEELIFNPIRIQAELDMYIASESFESTFYYDNETLVETRIKGSLDAFLDHSSYKNLYGYIDVDLNVKVNYAVEQFFELQELFIELDVKGQIHIIGSDVFLTLEIETYGQKIEVEVKLLDVIDEFTYNEFKYMLEDLDLPSFEGMEVPTDLVRLYEVGKNDHLEILLNTALHEMIANMHEGDVVRPGMWTRNVMINDIHNSSATLVFGTNGLEKAGIGLDVYVKFKDSYKGLFSDDTQIQTTTIRGNFNALIDFNAKDPSKRLTASSFKNHYELNTDLLTLIFTQGSFPDIDLG